jgi:hypothetical protein
MVHTGQYRTAHAASIGGGFVLVSLATLMAVWRACQSRPLGIGDFRAWLACREMVARRCLAEEDRVPAFAFAELANLLGVSRKRARASIRRLVDAGLLEWSEFAIRFPEQPLPDNPTLHDSIGGGRGSLAIPRRTLRFLAQNAGRALIATAIGVLLRCLSRRKEGWDARGRIKASWIAAVFGVSLRQIKAARRELIDLGWIEPEDSDQWALNRWGRTFRINLEWTCARPEGSTAGSRPATPPCPSPPAQGSTLTPPPLDSGPTLTPPDLQTKTPFGREKNQEPAGGTTGFSIEGSEEKTAHRDREPVGPKPVPAPTPAPILPVPKLADVRPEDLKDTGRLLDLFDQAIAQKLIGASEAERLKFVAAAEHALAIGKANPCGLFAYLVRGACWRYITQGDEDRANLRLKAHLRGPALPCGTSGMSRPSSRPALSEDAKLALRVRAALSAAGYRGDPYPQVRRHDPSWTRERWDAALSEANSN